MTFNLINKFNSSNVLIEDVTPKYMDNRDFTFKTVKECKEMIAWLKNQYETTLDTLGAVPIFKISQDSKSFTVAFKKPVGADEPNPILNNDSIYKGSILTDADESVVINQQRKILDTYNKRELDSTKDTIKILDKLDSALPSVISKVRTLCGEYYNSRLNLVGNEDYIDEIYYNSTRFFGFVWSILSDSERLILNTYASICELGYQNYYSSKVNRGDYQNNLNETQI